MAVRVFPLLALSTVMAFGCEGSKSTQTESEDSGASGGASSGGTPEPSGGGTPSTGGDSPPGGPTWAQDIAPIIQARCASCHVAGGAGPFALDTFEAARDMAPTSLNAIEGGRMPPWQASPDCRHYPSERLMPDAEKALFRAWVDGGLARGEGEPVLPQAQTIGLEPDVVGRVGEPYTPDPARPDDYRCFALDAVFDEETWVVGTQVMPDQVPIVHHVLVYVVPPEQLGTLEALEAEDEGPGYSCYGGPGVGGLGPMAAWVPGMQPQRSEPGTAQVIPAGARLVMQLHYNTLNSPAVPDETELHLQTTDEQPSFSIRSRPLAHLGIDIPAGEAEVVQARDFVERSREPVTLIGVGAHMHVLGESIRLDLVRANGESTCLVDIPKWDFNWQQQYAFGPDAHEIVQPGDTYRLRCVYDNSPENQAVVNGERLEPRRVTWGEGTTDEMCLSFITTLEPYGGAGATCGGFDACRMGCEDPNGLECALTCGQSDAACAQCIMPQVFGEGGCARTRCGETLAPAGGCIRNCVVEAVTTNGAISDCLVRDCPAEYAALSVCMDAAIEAGACDAGLSACGIER
ncbi:MAG: hypothetical protein ACOYM9_18955 [Bradymonadia bacterium]